MGKKNKKTKLEAYELDLDDIFTMIIMLPVACETKAEFKAVSKAVSRAWSPIIKHAPQVAEGVSKRFFDALNDNPVAHKVGERYFAEAIKAGAYDDKRIK